MKLFVHFDDAGQILPVAKVMQMEAGQSHPFLHSADVKHVMELEATAELRNLDAHEIAARYVVDMTAHTLKARSEIIPAAPKREKGAAKRKSKQ